MNDKITKAEGGFDTMEEMIEYLHETRDMAAELQKRVNRLKFWLGDKLWNDIGDATDRLFYTIREMLRLRGYRGGVP